MGCGSWKIREWTRWRGSLRREKFAANKGGKVDLRVKQMGGMGEWEWNVRRLDFTRFKRIIEVFFTPINKSFAIIEYIITSTFKVEVHKSRIRIFYFHSRSRSDRFLEKRAKFFVDVKFWQICLCQTQTSSGISVFCFVVADFADIVLHRDRACLFMILRSSACCGSPRHFQKSIVYLITGNAW